jgi:hypothetical protein
MAIGRFAEDEMHFGIQQALVLLRVGLGGQVGLTIVDFVFRRHFTALLIGLPSALAISPSC